MSALQVAADHARSRARLAEKLRLEARDAWAQVDPARISETWLWQIPRLLLLLTGGQHAAAVTADGRPLESLLAQPGITAKVALSSGATLDRAMAAGNGLAQLIAHTQVADAGRVADQVALTSRRHATGYTRMVVGATCSRCIVLAGRWYRWNAGFNRHPKCDCIGIPAPENAEDLRTDPKRLFTSMSAAEQDQAFGQAGAQAIRDGADMAKVVNARRGMQTADGRLYTTEAAGKRPRLMPEQIFRDARDRDDAIRLLKRHGYIV
jgi:hypothetical protein